jgi:hypothetical protein
MISLMQRIEELEGRVREIEHDHAGRDPLCPPR